MSSRAGFGLAAVNLAANASAYTALNSADYQPADHEAEVAVAIAAAQSVASA